MEEIRKCAYCGEPLPFDAKKNTKYHLECQEKLIRDHAIKTRNHNTAVNEYILDQINGTRNVCPRCGSTNGTKTSVCYYCEHSWKRQISAYYKGQRFSDIFNPNLHLECVICGKKIEDPFRLTCRKCRKHEAQIEEERHPGYLEDTINNRLSRLQKRNKLNNASHEQQRVAAANRVKIFSTEESLSKLIKNLTPEQRRVQDRLIATSESDEAFRQRYKPLPKVYDPYEDFEAYLPSRTKKKNKKKQEAVSQDPVTHTHESVDTEGRRWTVECRGQWHPYMGDKHQG